MAVKSLGMVPVSVFREFRCVFFLTSIGLLKFVHLDCLLYIGFGGLIHCLRCKKKVFFFVGKLGSIHKTTTNIVSCLMF